MVCCNQFHHHHHCCLHHRVSVTPLYINLLARSLIRMHYLRLLYITWKVFRSIIDNTILILLLLRSIPFHSIETRRDLFSSSLVSLEWNEVATVRLHWSGTGIKTKLNYLNYKFNAVALCRGWRSVRFLTEATRISATTSIGSSTCSIYCIIYLFILCMVWASSTKSALQTRYVHTKCSNGGSIFFLKTGLLPSLPLT